MTDPTPLLAASPITGTAYVVAEFEDAGPRGKVRATEKRPVRRDDVPGLVSTEAVHAAVRAVREVAR